MPPGLGLGSGVTADPSSGLFGSTPLLLDTYPNAHRAYSVRKLRTDYTGYAMTVREGSGANYTADVSFNDDGVVAADSPVANLSGGSGATIDEFMSSYDGFVTTWYDQSGEGSNATQGTAGGQPKIYSSGSIITEGDGDATASLLFDGTDDVMYIDEYGLSLASVTAFTVLKNTDQSSEAVWFLSTASGNYYGHYKSTTDQFWYDDGSVSAATSTTDQKLFSYKGAIYSQILYVNGAAATGTGSSYASDYLTDSYLNGIGAFAGYYYWGGKFQEFIVYDSDQSSNLTAIESDINTAFNIY